MLDMRARRSITSFPSLCNKVSFCRFLHKPWYIPYLSFSTHVMAWTVREISVAMENLGVSLLWISMLIVGSSVHGQNFPRPSASTTLDRHPDCVQSSLPSVKSLRDSLAKSGRIEETFAGCHEWISGRGFGEEEVEMTSSCKNFSVIEAGGLSDTDRLRNSTSRHLLILRMPRKESRLILSGQKLVDIGQSLVTAMSKGLAIQDHRLLNDTLAEYERGKCGIIHMHLNGDNNRQKTKNAVDSMLLAYGEKALHFGEAVVQILSPFRARREAAHLNETITPVDAVEPLPDVRLLFEELGDTTEEARNALRLLQVSRDLKTSVDGFVGFFKQANQIFKLDLSAHRQNVKALGPFLKSLLCYAAFPQHGDHHGNNKKYLPFCPSSHCFRVGSVLRGLHRLTQQFIPGLKLIQEAWTMLCDSPRQTSTNATKLAGQDCIFPNLSRLPTSAGDLQKQSSTLRLSKVFKKREDNLVCGAWKCPHPLVYTDNNQHVWPAIKVVLPKIKTITLTNFPDMPLTNRNIFPCGTACLSPALSARQVNVFRAMHTVAGWLSLSITLVAVVGFLVNHRAIVALPSRICAYINMTFLLAIAVFILGTMPGFAKSIACHEDGTLRLKNHKQGTGCLVFASIGIFSMVLLHSLLLCLSHAWYRLVVLLESGVRKASNEHLRDRRLEVGYVCGSLLIAVLLTFLSSLEADSMGQLVGRACISSPSTFLHYVCFSSLAMVCVETPLIATGLIKLVRFSRASQRSLSKLRIHRRSSRLSTWSSTAGLVSSKPSRGSRSKVGLERMIKLLCAPMIVSTIHLIVLLETTLRVIPEDDRVARQMTVHVMCAFLQVQPNSTCPPLPQMSTDLHLFPSLCLYSASVIFCSWTLDWKYWDHLWIVKKLRNRGGSRLQSTRSLSNRTSTQSSTCESQVSSVLYRSSMPHFHRLTAGRRTILRVTSM